MGTLAVNHPICQLPQESQPLKRGIIPVRSRRGLRAKKNSETPDSGRVTAYSEVTSCLATRNWLTPSGEISTGSRVVVSDRSLATRSCMGLIQNWSNFRLV